LLADQALGAADWLDLMISEGKPLPPLAGLAIVVKDNINIRGLPTTAGTPALQRSCPATTAPSVQKLIDAGAIVVGKTNMHELGYGATSINLASFAGPVRNPYAFDMIAGGSSGGTAAAISSRIVTCGLGTDTGGSCRIPAALTGIVGFRPSVGNGGSQRRYHDELAVVPISHTRDTIGPLGRSVADVTLLDSIITGVPRARPVELPGLRVGIACTLWSGLDERSTQWFFRRDADLKWQGSSSFTLICQGCYHKLQKYRCQSSVMEPC
jgi:mandelamide amidase